MGKGKYAREFKKENNFLRYKFFKIGVLDRYREDPRYMISEGPISMFLSIKDEFSADLSIPEEDKFFIQSLGYAYKKKDNTRVIITYLAYLAELPEKQQNHWASFEENEECILDEDFCKQEFMAEFTERVNIFDAFIQELEEINKICSLTGKPAFFKETFKNKKPSDFCRISKPTYKAYYHLIHLFDKLLSENINKEFFKGKVEPIDEEGREKGTLKLLNEYLGNSFIPQDARPMEEMLSHFKKIRKDRQKPAHSIEEDIYDDKYFDLSEELIKQSYKSIRLLRLIFMNFPRVKEKYCPPDWLQKGEII